MWFKTILCRIGLHNWKDYVTWKWKYETGSMWKMKECKHCGTKKYRKV